MSTSAKFHPASEIFDLLQGDDFRGLVENIKKHGLLTTIWLHPDGSILDGRNRYRACVEANVEPRFQTWDAQGSAADFVWSLNFTRRHLEGNARKLAASKYAIELEREAKERQGARTDLTSSSFDDEVSFGRSTELAGEKFGLGQKTVERGVKVIKDGAKVLIDAVARDAVSVSAAADVASLPQEEQAEIVARGERQILLAAKEIRFRRTNERRAERLAKLKTISEGSAELPSDRRYPLLYADPPWPYHVYDGEIGTQYGAADNHYPLMSLEEICKLPVQNLATPAAILFMWTTSSHLAVAMQVLTAWGFEYVTNIAWVKQSARLGYWVRNQHETLLVARRGDMPTPVPANKSPSVIMAPRRKHSCKPDEAYELIERMYPDLPKIELFARQAREGWAAWGNQAPPTQIAEAA